MDSGPSCIKPLSSCKHDWHDDKEPHPELFANRKGIQADVKYPSMDELTKGWDEIGKKLTARLSEMTEEELSNPTPFQIPTGNNTLQGPCRFYFSS